MPSVGKTIPHDSATGHVSDSNRDASPKCESGKCVQDSFVHFHGLSCNDQCARTAFVSLRSPIDGAQ